MYTSTKNKNSREIIETYRQFDSERYLQDIKAIDWNTIYD